MTTLEFGADPNVVALLRGVHPVGHIPRLAHGFEDLITTLNQQPVETQDRLPVAAKGAMRPVSISEFNPNITYVFKGVPVNRPDGRVAFAVEATRYPDIPSQMAEISRQRLRNGKHFQDELQPFPDGYEWGEFALGLVPKAIARASGIVVVTLRNRPRR